MEVKRDTVHVHAMAMDTDEGRRVQELGKKKECVGREEEREGKVFRRAKKMKENDPAVSIACHAGTYFFSSFHHFFQVSHGMSQGKVFFV